MSRAEHAKANAALFGFPLMNEEEFGQLFERGEVA